jgi:hypothetical protein
MLLGPSVIEACVRAGVANMAGGMPGRGDVGRRRGRCLPHLVLQTTTPDVGAAQGNGEEIGAAVGRR